MKKAFTCSLAILVIAVLAWAGGEPWKTKRYQQWNDEDIQKVFTDSPWSRKVTVEGTWKPVQGVNSASGSINAGGSGGAKGMGGSSTVLPAEADVNAGTRGPSVPFDVYWMSSETMRAALARRAVLHAGKDEASIEKYVETPAEEYQVVVQGPDMAPFYHNEEKFFEANSALEVKKTKQKFSPSHVVYNRDDKGAITSAVFFFPKKLNGQDTISASDKSVEFTCKLGNSTLHAVFEPTKMVNQKGSDL
ncbi:MAG: hypothetical protein WAN14_12220 [Candidatus Acidiferrales bacterium]